MAKHSNKKLQKRRRRKVSAEAPLALSGEVDLLEFVDPPRSSWIRFKMSLANSWPVHEDSGQGRQRAAIVRLVLGATALYLVTKGKTNVGLAVLGVIVALTLLFIPMPNSRRRRWQDRLRKRTEPVEQRRRVPAEITYNGKKLAVRANDRAWKSLRPGSPRCSVVVYTDDDTLWLGLVPTGRVADSGLWFATDRGSVGETFDPLNASPRMGILPECCWVSGEAWATLHEVFHGIGKQR